MYSDLYLRCVYTYLEELQEHTNPIPEVPETLEESFGHKTKKVWKYMYRLF